MRIGNGQLNIDTTLYGANVKTLRLGNKDFFFPQHIIDQKGETFKRGGMHICSPIFGSPEGKGLFSKAPQHGELREMRWEGQLISKRNPAGVSYACRYRKWGVKLDYFVAYYLEGKRLTALVEVRNKGKQSTPVELAWHPYFASPKGGTVKFVNGNVKDIVINGPYEAKIFPAAGDIIVELNGVGTVKMKLEDGFNEGFVCVWTDWRRRYFCVEPLLSYKTHSKGVLISVGKSILAKFSMEFEVA